ncbi:unnamed protein product [Symbiodinium sp. CCMP2456]|nr:unnamed protein product [Symbiodinium sp. CCMP2456]
MATGSFIDRFLKEEDAGAEAADEEMLPHEELEEPEAEAEEGEGDAEWEEELELPAEEQPAEEQPAEEEDPELDAKFQGLLETLQAEEDEAAEEAAVQEPSKPSRPPQVAPWHQQKPIGGFTKPREPRGPPPPDVARASKRRTLDLREGHGRLQTSSTGAWNVMPPPPPARPPTPASLQGAEVAPGAKVVPPREPGGEAAASASSVGPRPPKGAPPPGLREQKGDGRVVPARKQKETPGPAERSANASAALEKAKDLFSKGKKNGDQAFSPPVRWNVAGAKSSNLRESLQKHLAMKKQEELRKHEEKTATKQKTPAEPRPWKESSSAQAAPTPSAPSRPPPSSGSAWESAALRLKATGTTEKDKMDLKNFVSDLQLNDEQVELGLQFLERSKLRSLLAQKDRVLKSCQDPAARIETVRKMIAAADPAADELVRRIDREDRDVPKAAASPAPKTPPKAPPKKVPPPPSKPPPKEILQGAEGAPRTLRKAIEEASKRRPPEPKQAPPKQAPQKLWPTEKAHPPAKAPAPEAARGSTPPPPPPQGPPPGTAPPKARPASASRSGAKAPSTPPPAPPAPAPQPPKPKPSAPSQPAVPPPPPGPPPPPQVMPKAELRPRMPKQGKPQPPKTPPPTIPKAVTFPAAKAPPAKMVPPPPKASGAQAEGRDRSRSRDRQNAAAGEAHGEAHGEAPDDMAAFLRELDPSGQMDSYAPRLRTEFGSRAQLRAAVVDEAASGLAMVDPAVFEALQMRALGHKLLLVRGLKKLLSSE